MRHEDGQYLNKGVIQVYIYGNSFQRPGNVCDIVDVTIHVHVASPCHLHSSFVLQVSTKVRHIASHDSPYLSVLSLHHIDKSSRDCSLGRILFSERKRWDAR